MLQKILILIVILLVCMCSYLTFKLYTLNTVKTKYIILETLEMQLIISRLPILKQLLTMFINAVKIRSILPQFIKL